MDELFRLSTIAVLSALLAGCTNFSPQEQPKQTAGTVLGAIGGGLLGAQVGSGAGQLAATAAGTLAGAWLGREVGASLDRANRLHAQQATYTALEHNPTGTASTWRNPDTGHYGAVTPTRTYKTAERDCRDFEQTVVIDGQEETVQGTACREPDGTWGRCEQDSLTTAVSSIAGGDSRGQLDAGHAPLTPPRQEAASRVPIPVTGQEAISSRATKARQKGRHGRRTPSCR